MNLSERIDSDLKEAMRARDATKLGVLRMLKSALKYAAIAKSGTEAELSDAEAAQVIRKQVKQRQDSIESFEKGGRTELAEKEREELPILNAYLPQAMSADDVAKLVRETIPEPGKTHASKPVLALAPCLAGCHTAELEPGRDIGERIAPRHEPVGLEHVTGLSVHACERLAEDSQRSGGGPEETGGDMAPGRRSSAANPASS